MLAVDTIYNNIDYLFGSDWKCSKMSDRLRYTNSLVPLDEYVITTDNTDNTDNTNTSVLNVSIPLYSIAYKTTFYNLNDAINYVKMHLEYYKI